jgi:D-alanine--poly(phosphoribitol) ligase subunit 1
VSKDIEMDKATYNIGLRFQSVVERLPTAPALFCDDRCHDFDELNKSANRFARWLTGQGIGRGAVVCLELPKIFEAYALALACIKIGAPYAFLDPLAPAERAQLMIDRCRPGLIVTVREGGGNRVIIGDASARAELERVISELASDNLSETALITGTDPAYVMFTSGSTGEPKGVVIPHQGILHLAEWAKDDLGIGPTDRLTNVNPNYFDNSVFDIYAGLLNGAAIVALDALKGRPPAELVLQITEHRCTFFFAVPTLFMFLDSMHLLTPGKLPSVTRFMFGGEGFPIARLRRFHTAFAGKAKLINCYGPTETSCICSGFEIDESVFDTTDGLPPLGRLNPNFSYRILDQDLNPVVDGTVGELWIGGPGVGLGYINNPEETKRRFRQDPLISGYRAVQYRSGDLVEAEVGTGILRFRGRADNQVKLRGYRVELEEIDHAIMAHAGITRALTVVLNDANGGSRLLAGYSGTMIEDADLRRHCASRLPNYMVPSRFVWLEEVPTNANGKADRGAVAQLLGKAELAGRRGALACGKL